MADLEAEKPGFVNPIIAHDFDKKTRSLDVTVEGVESDIDFSGLYLNEEVLNGLITCGFLKPSPIQLRGIPLGRLGLDLLLQAKSGTGKTCVFSVIVLENITVTKNTIQSLVITPCREIAYQNADVMRNIGSCKDGLSVKVFIGGKPVENDCKRLLNCHVAVGTPGRLAHLIKDYEMDLSNVRVLVLDEADKLMDASFFSDIQTIFEAMPNQKQIISASATYLDGVDNFILRFMKDPITVRLDVGTPVLLAMDQYVLHVKKMVKYDEAIHPKLSPEEVFRHKFKCLTEIFRRVEFTQAIIFSAFQMRAEKIYDKLRAEDVDVVLLSGALDQSSRLESLSQLQQGKCRIMVATDVAARGIDCESVDLVINFECPEEMSTYIHRMGRAGRFGTRGTVITFLVYSSEWKIIENFRENVHFELNVLLDFNSLDSITLKSYSDPSDVDRCQAFGREKPVSTGGVDVEGMWDYCKNREQEDFTLEEYTFQGIFIRTKTSVMAQNIARVKSVFTEAKKKHLLERGSRNNEVRNESERQSGDTLEESKFTTTYEPNPFENIPPSNVESQGTNEISSIIDHVNLQQELNGGLLLGDDDGKLLNSQGNQGMGTIVGVEMPSENNFNMDSEQDLHNFIPTTTEPLDPKALDLKNVETSGCSEMSKLSLESDLQGSKVSQKLPQTSTKRARVLKTGLRGRVQAGMLNRGSQGQTENSMKRSGYYKDSSSSEGD